MTLPQPVQDAIDKAVADKKTVAVNQDADDKANAVSAAATAAELVTKTTLTASQGVAIESAHAAIDLLTAELLGASPNPKPPA